MPNDHKSHDPIRLTVLPNSGKVEHLRNELMSEPPVPAPDATVAAERAKPLAGRTPVDMALQSSGKTIRQKLIEGKVIDACRRVFDPEIPVNIYDLGLIYKIDVSPDDKVRVEMTLTAPGCPVAGTLPGDVQRQIQQVPEVVDAEVVLVWEPAWDKSRMSEAAMLELGFM
ncbi:MAG TPA: DUF59 domain-containing protein [Tepidisphaeraceae bacterium]|nr:DUF59 domain-containing protein [Tepidisphaeraceae bacterium]